MTWLFGRFKQLCELLFNNSGKSNDESHVELPEIESEAKGAPRELPEYLRKRLKARGLLKDDMTSGCTTTEKVRHLDFLFSQAIIYGHKVCISYT